MKKDFKVKAVNEKVELLEINGQALFPGCLTDCESYRWFGNQSNSTKGCYQQLILSPYRRDDL